MAEGGFWIEPDRVFAVAPAGGTRADLSDGFHTFRELYRERSALTAALARMFLSSDANQRGRAWIGFDTQPGFDGYRTVLYIDLPGVGQVSWHFADDDATEFLRGFPSSMSSAQPPYDGHTTAEKHERVERFARDGHDG
jgi:hypothetical protein